MNDLIVHRLLFRAIVLSVVLCVSGCAETATEVEDGKTVFTFPISFLVITTLFSLGLGSVFFLVLIIGPIIALVEMLRAFNAFLAPSSASQQEPAEPISTGTKPDRDWRAWVGLVVLVLAGPLVGSFILCELGQRIHAGFNDKVILSDSGFTSDVWYWFEPHSQQYRFNEIRAMRIWHTRSSGKGARRHSHANITLKSGHEEEIRVNELLWRAWPEIARKAVSKGVHIEGDF